MPDFKLTFLKRRVFPAIVLILSLFAAESMVAAKESERPFDLTPYRVKVVFVDVPESRDTLPTEQVELMGQSLKKRSQALLGAFWEFSWIDTEHGRESVVQLIEMEKKRASKPARSAVFPIDGRPFNDTVNDARDDGFGEDCDKLFVIVRNRTERTESFRITEYDVKTQFLGRSLTVESDRPEKRVDTLMEGLLMAFSPLVRLEQTEQRSTQSAGQQAEFRVQAARVPQSGNDSTTSSEPMSLGRIAVQNSVLLPIARSLDRDGRIIASQPIPWTAVLTESVGSDSKLLRGRVVSGLRDPLGMKRRGRTEILALCIPTPNEPTILRLKPRIESLPNILPPYEVFETIDPSEPLVRIGRTGLDGLFRLEAEASRPIRFCSFRSGRTTITQIPVIRGFQDELSIPVADDPVRLQAEAFVLQLQEEIIDVKARQLILEKQLRKLEELSDGDSRKQEARQSRTRNELNQLKSDSRFLTDLEQAKLRFRSEDPLVQRRIDRLFQDTAVAIKRIGATKR